ncbi:MAG: hypothetical protein KJ601_05260 [Nanoarchaeota archaeon]|nr:hypothetical protein [Nanoarchaeota archaeon]
MTLEWTQNILFTIIDFFALLTMIFASLFALKIIKKKAKLTIKAALAKTFSMLAVGYILYAAAELIWHMITLAGGDPSLGIAEYFWVIGAVFVFSAFAYFAAYMYKEHKEYKKGLLLLVSSSVVALGLLYYLIGNFIVGFQTGERALEMFFDYYYPISSALILIASVNVYLFFKKLKDFGHPLLFLAISSLFTFLGDMAYTYYSWNDIYGIIGLLSDSFYCIEYILAAIAFYMLFKTLTTKGHETKHSKLTHHKKVKWAIKAFNPCLAARIIALIISLGGITVMLGWFLGIPALTSILPVWGTMPFSTALCFFLSGIILYLTCLWQQGTKKDNDMIIIMSGLIILFFMATLLISMFVGLSTGIEDIFVKEASDAVKTNVQGRPSAGTMISFILIAIAGLLAVAKAKKTTKKLMIIGSAVTIIGTIGILGYILNLPVLYYSISDWSTAMAFHTAILLTMAGIGLFILGKSGKEVEA